MRNMSFYDFDGVYSLWQRFLRYTVCWLLHHKPYDVGGGVVVCERCGGIAVVLEDKTK